MAVNIGKRLAEGLNKQVNEEMIASYMFLGMSGVFTDMGLNNCAKWALSEYEYYRTRALKIFNYLLLRGVKVTLLPIPAVKSEWRAPLHMLDEANRMSQRLAESIAAMCDATMAEKDYASRTFLAWFANEQIKKSAFLAYLLDRLRKMQSTDLGVLMFDAQFNENIPEDK